MAQNITTILAKTAITAAEIEAATNVLNYLYLVHGTGSSRSKKIELGELLLFLSRNTKFSVLKLIKDENTDIPLYWDNDNTELVIWDRANTNKVGLPKAHVHGTLEVEKDTTIRADVSITKTLTVGGRADFDGNFTVIKNLFATEHAELQGVSKLQMNMTSGAIIKCSVSANPTLPADSPIGARILVCNDTDASNTVRAGTHVYTVAAQTAHEFIRVNNAGYDKDWLPISSL